MERAQFFLNEEGETILQDYNRAEPFSSFFPGIAGTYGIPLWVFYVNRGQGIASFGIESKEKSILEFFPANRAYQLTTHLGFRTFIKYVRGKESLFFEPFRNNPPLSKEKALDSSNEMIFTSYSLKLKESIPSLGLSIQVRYFTIATENFPGLAREVSFQYRGDTPISLEICDGLPWVNANGIGTWTQKHMSRTGEAWIEVINLENQVPLYKVKVEIADKPETEIIESGHFSYYFDESNSLLPAIVDPQVIFGSNTDLIYPASFIQSQKFIPPKNQTFENFTPCAMTFDAFTLESGQTKKIFGIFGHAKNVSIANQISSKCNSKIWFENKFKENQRVVQEVQDHMSTYSSSKYYDAYCQHTFLDNVLRGGLAFSLPGGDEHKNICHIYSRKHGDLERDYNQFLIQPSYFSQGNGNFRDVNQNRRNDLWFNPQVMETNIRTFFNLLQLDGHNPLVIKSALFLPKNIDLNSLLESLISDPLQVDQVRAILKQPFAPGPLWGHFLEEKIELSVSFDVFLKELLPHCIRIEDADHGEGFWSDHWTYNLDLIENYLGLYPENKIKLLIQDNNFTFYQNYAWINPRSIRYVIRNGKPFQTNNIEEDHEFMENKSFECSFVKINYGKGDIYKTNLISKLICLIINKIATLDPFGVGIEFEGGKPNWYDALNGLPGLFGSSINETLELKRLILYLLPECVATLFSKVKIPHELGDFLEGMDLLLIQALNDESCSLFSYWDQSASLKEQYRKSVKFGIKGDEKEYSPSFIKSFLNRCLQKLDRGIDSAFDPETKVIRSYFINECIEYDIISSEGRNKILPKKFKQIPLALFLEGPVHKLKMAGSSAKEQYDAVKASSLFDSKLKMFKVNASLKEMPLEIGRCTIFTPGWLENESIWLHMEYKFLLETLRAGFSDDFFIDFKNVLIPFQDSKQYGRSILENSSFIVSSANPNEKLHGRGFVARLSGSTAEFIHMWLIMNLGHNPFRIDSKGELLFQPAPILAHWLFSSQVKTISWNNLNQEKTIQLPSHHFAFKILGQTLVVYQNVKGGDTFGPKAVKPKKMTLENVDGTCLEIEGDTLRGELALGVRQKKFTSILIELQ